MGDLAGEAWWKLEYLHPNPPTKKLRVLVRGSNFGIPVEIQPRIFIVSQSMQEKTNRSEPPVSPAMEESESSTFIERWLSIFPIRYIKSRNK